MAALQRILAKPQEGATVSVALGQDTLYACSADKVFRLPLGSLTSDWRAAGGDPHNRQYSPLNQINRDNVHRLQQAWVYHCGDAETGEQPHADSMQSHHRARQALRDLPPTETLRPQRRFGRPPLEL